MRAEMTRTVPGVQPVRFEALVDVAGQVGHLAVQSRGEPTPKCRGVAGEVGVGDADLLKPQFPGPSFDIPDEGVIGRLTLVSDYGCAWPALVPMRLFHHQFCVDLPSGNYRQSGIVSIRRRGINNVDDERGTA